MGVGPGGAHRYHSRLRETRDGEPMRTVSISDRYEATEGTVLLSGIEALVRLLLTATTPRRDPAAVDGALHQRLRRARRWEVSTNSSNGRTTLLSEADIVFTPGLNEELAATAVGGTQLTGELPGRRVDGVVGFWYGKNPGLDRAADAIRHASMSRDGPPRRCGGDSSGTTRCRSPRPCPARVSRWPAPWACRSSPPPRWATSSRWASMPWRCRAMPACGAR